MNCGPKDDRALTHEEIAHQLMIAFAITLKVVKGIIVLVLAIAWAVVEGIRRMIRRLLAREPCRALRRLCIPALRSA